MKTTKGPQMRSLLASGALALSIMLAGCGVSAGSRSTKTASPVPAGEIVYIVHGPYSTSTAGIVALHPANGTASPLLTLPMGLTTQDHQRLYAATTANGHTSISAYDTRTGAKLSTFTIAGAYAMDGRGYAGAVISPDGRWLVLRQAGQAETGSGFAVVDTQARTLAQTISLPGDFDLDAISPNGAMLYLLQNLNDADHHYYVRAYDLNARHLLDTIIVDKSEINETKMVGTAVTRQMSDDGSMAYTLYIDPAHNHAFVHILPLASGPDGPPFARCVDLPSGASADLLHFYTLTRSPDGAYLYAANGALGVVAAISLHGDNIYDDKVEVTNRFDATANATANDAARTLYHGAALSSDGQTLYVAGLRGIWALHASNLHVQRAYAANEAFTSVALSANGKLLYATDPAHGLLAIALAAPQSAQSLWGAAQSPWGIAWVSA